MVVIFGEQKSFTFNLNERHKIKKEHFVCIPHVKIAFHKKKVTMINTDSNTVIKYRESISTSINKGRSLLTGGSLLSGFTRSHKKLTLISGGLLLFGGLYYRNFKLDD